MFSNTIEYQEAEKDLIKKLTDYDKIEQIMDFSSANAVKRAVKKCKTPFTLDDLEMALDDIEDDDYHNFFDRLFLEIVVNNCSPDTILNKEQSNIIIDYTFAINNREEDTLIGYFLSQNQDKVQEYRKWVAKEQRLSRNKCVIC
jgi:hypothetical protein